MSRHTLSGRRKFFEETELISKAGVSSHMGETAQQNFRTTSGVGPGPRGWKLSDVARLPQMRRLFVKANHHPHPATS